MNPEKFGFLARSLKCARIAVRVIPSAGIAALNSSGVGSGAGVPCVTGPRDISRSEVRARRNHSTHVSLPREPLL